MSTFLSGFRQYTTGAKLLGIAAILLLSLVCFPALQKYFSKRSKTLLCTAGIWALLCLCPVTALGLLWYQSAYYDYTALWEPALLLPVCALGLGTLMAEILIFWQEKGKASSLFRERVCPPLLVVLILLITFLCGDAGYGSWKSGALAGDEAQLKALRAELLTLTEKEGSDMADASGTTAPSDKALIWAPREVLSYLPMAGADFALYYGRDLWDASLAGFTYDTYDEAKRDAESWMYAVSLQDVFFFEDNWSSVFYSEGIEEETTGNKNGITSCRKALDAGVDVIVLPCRDRTDVAGLDAICEALGLTALTPAETGCEGYYILLRTALAPQ